MSLDEIVLSIPLQLMRSPCVYIVRDGPDVLYVGSSAKGINRPFDPGHHVLKSVTSATARVEIICYATEEDCREQEEFLIAALQPQLNRANHTIDLIAKKLWKVFKQENQDLLNQMTPRAIAAKAREQLKNNQSK